MLLSLFDLLIRFCPMVTVFVTSCWLALRVAVLLLPASARLALLFRPSSCSESSAVLSKVVVREVLSLCLG